MSISNADGGADVSGDSDTQPGIGVGSDGGSVPPWRPGSTRRRWARWPVALVVTATAIYGVVRLVAVQSELPTRLAERGDDAARWYFVEYFGETRLGDAQVTHVNGVPIANGNAPDLILKALDGDAVRLRVSRGDVAQEFAAPAIRWGVQWSRLGVGIAIGFLGALGFWLRPASKSAASFAVFCVFVLILWTTRAIPWFERSTWEQAAYFLFRMYLPVAGIFFGLTFSALRNVVRRPSYAVWGMFAACTGLIVFNAITSDTIGVSSGVRPVTTALWGILLLFTVVLLMPYRLWNRLAGLTPSPTDRQRAFVVRWAVFLSFLPSLLYTLVLLAFDIAYNRSLASELIVLVFPAAMLYSIFRHNLLSLNDLLLETVLYGLLGGVLLLGYGALAALGARWLPGQDEWLRAGLVGIAAVAAVPVHTRVRGLMDMRFNRVSFEYESLADVLDDLLPKCMTAEDYCHEAAQTIGRAAQTEDVSIILRRPGQRGLTVTGATPRPDSENLIAECQVLIEDLEEQPSGFSLDDVLEGWRRGRRQTTTLQLMRSLNASVVVPLHSQRQLIGAILLGPRVDERNYTRGELTTFGRVARHLAANLLQILNRSAAIVGNRVADRYPACPERIGRFAIDRILGEGGMAYVFRGRSHDGLAAIKVCNRYVQSNSKLMERFHREGIAMQRLDHPNVVRVIEAGWEGPEPYIATEYLAGGTLQEVVRLEGPLPEGQVLQHVRDVARGLEAALREGIIHRDIKPRNLFLTAEDRVKVGDFGLARIADETTLTEAGQVFGTPHFMSPEVLDGHPADWRSDQYALGVTMFYLLTGRYPFESESPEVLARKYMNDPMPSLKGVLPDASDAADALFRRMTSRAPGDRFGSYAEIVAAISR